MIPIPFGQIVRTLRIGKGLSQTALAAAMGVSLPTVQRVEAKKSFYDPPVLRPGNVKALADVLEVRMLRLPLAFSEADLSSLRKTDACLPGPSRSRFLQMIWSRSFAPWSRRFLAWGER